MESRSEHRKDAPREVDGRRAAATLVIERGSVAHVVRDVGDMDAQPVSLGRALDLHRIVEVLGGLSVDRHDSTLTEILAAEQVLFGHFLRIPRRLGEDGLRKARRQTVRSKHDLDVDTGLSEKTDPFFDDPVGHPARVRKGRQADLHDLPIASTPRLPFRYPDHRVDPRIVRKDDGLALLAFESSDDTFAGPIEDLDHGPRNLLGTSSLAPGPGPLLAGQHRVSVHGAMHPCPGNEEVRPTVDQHEAEPLRANRQPAGQGIGMFDGGVLLAPNLDDLPFALESVEDLPEPVFFLGADTESPGEIPKGQYSRAFLAQFLDDLGGAGQHARQCIRRVRTRPLVGHRMPRSWRAVCSKPPDLNVCAYTRPKYPLGGRPDAFDRSRPRIFTLPPARPAFVLVEMIHSGKEHL